MIILQKKKCIKIGWKK